MKGSVDPCPASWPSITQSSGQERNVVGISVLVPIMQPFRGFINLEASRKHNRDLSSGSAFKTKLKYLHSSSLGSYSRERGAATISKRGCGGSDAGRYHQELLKLMGTTYFFPGEIARFFYLRCPGATIETSWEVGEEGIYCLYTPFPTSKKLIFFPESLQLPILTIIQKAISNVNCLCE